MQIKSRNTRGRAKKREVVDVQIIAPLSQVNLIIADDGKKFTELMMSKDELRQLVGRLEKVVA